MEFVNKEKDKFKKDENNNTIYPSLPNIRDNIIIANTQLTEETKWIKETQGAMFFSYGELKLCKSLQKYEGIRYAVSEKWRMYDHSAADGCPTERPRKIRHPHHQLRCFSILCSGEKCAGTGAGTVEYTRALIT